MTTVLVRVEGRIGRITLNRPAALNALTLDMVRHLDRALIAWARDDRVAIVLIDGTGDRAFCAGGDIRALYDAAGAQDWAPLTTFFREEYHLNARIARYPKPVVAVMDGITMGGGIGIGGHASHRIVTERSKLAMPETRIGFFPDVGGTHLLGMAPGELGTHLALTSGRVDAADAIAGNLADWLVPVERLGAVPAQLAACESAADVSAALQAVAVTPPRGALADARTWIDRCYAGDRAEAIVAALRDAPEPDARQAAGEITANSPTSVKVTLAALRRARRLGTIEPCLNQEFRLALSLTRDPDFREGVRAAVVDKDRQPRWSPADLPGVSDAAVERHFLGLGAGELGLAAIEP
ncbi:MAG: enoyl-CoA hydratase/isomerase family protein [Azospirillaceae bacterium]|nr:enoyl-CoA hydratase/isomerase family protein [Azospirillaceae bacterium]